MPAKFGNRAPGPHTAEDSCQVPPFVGPFANTAAFSVMLLPASGASLRASKRTAPNSDKGISSEARLRTPRLVGSLSPGPFHRALVSAAGPVQAKPDPGNLFAPRTSHAHERVASPRRDGPLGTRHLCQPCRARLSLPSQRVVLLSSLPVVEKRVQVAAPRRSSQVCMCMRCPIAMCPARHQCDPSD